MTLLFQALVWVLPGPLLSISRAMHVFDNQPTSPQKRYIEIPPLMAGLDVVCGFQLVPFHTRKHDAYVVYSEYLLCTTVDRTKVLS